MTLAERRRALMGAQAESGPIIGYDVVGSPTIVDGIMTPNATGWIKSPVAFLPGEKTWKIVFRAKNKSNIGYNNYMTATGIILQRVSAQANVIAHLTHETTGDISNNKQRAFTLDAWKWCKLEFTGSTYVYGISDDGETWSDVTISSLLTIKQSSALIFGSKASNTSAVTADYDLSAIQVWIDGSLWWKAI